MEHRDLSAKAFKVFFSAALALLICPPVVSMDSKETAIEKLTSSKESSQDIDIDKNNREPQEVSAKEEKARFQVRRDHHLKKHSLAVAIGQTFLHGGFRKHGTDSITPEIYYGYSASHSFDLLINFHLSRHKKLSKEKNKKTFSQISGIGVGIKGRVFQFDLFAPFIIGGLGVYNPKIKREYNDEGVTSDSHLTFGHHFGSGVELELNRNFSLAFMGHYHNPYDVKQEASFEIEGSYFKLLITTSYIF